MRSLSLLLTTLALAAAAAPDGAGPPDDAGPPEDSGAPDGAGPPDDAGPPSTPEGCLLPTMYSNWEEDRKIEYCFDLTSTPEDDSEDPIVAGKICIMGRIETELKVRVEASEGYILLKNHVWVGTDVGDIPLHSSGRVDTSAFPEQQCDSNAELTRALWTIHENHNPCEPNKGTMNFVVLGVSEVENATTGERTMVYGYEHDADDGSPLPWMDVTLWCGCDGFYTRRGRNLRGLN